MVTPSPFAYHQFYCEENAYLLCQTLEHVGLADAKSLSLVFLTNDLEQVMLCRQRAGRGHAGLVVWDYHVFVVQRRQGLPSLIWDQDSTLPLPCSGEEYALEAFKLDLSWEHPSKHRRFCEVPWGHAKRQFASDRRHMRKAPPTTAQAEPPSSQHEGIGNHTSGAQSFGSRANDAESASPLSREDGSETGETLTSHTAHAVLNSRTQCGSNCGACGNSGVAASESGTGDMCSPHQARGNLAGDVEWQSPPPPWPCIQSPEAGCEHNLDGYLKRACSPARTTHPTGSPNQEGEDGVTAIGEPDKQRSSLVGTSLSQEEFLLLHCFSDDAAMAAAIDAHRELYR